MLEESTRNLVSKFNEGMETGFTDMKDNLDLKVKDGWFLTITSGSIHLPNRREVIIMA